MKSFLILFQIIFFFFVIQCKDVPSDRNVTTIKKNPKVTSCFLLSDRLTDKYSFRNNETGDTMLQNIDTLSEKSFSEAEKNTVPKQYESYYIAKETYYILKENSRENYTLKAIIYEGYADLASAVFIQLNTYDTKGKIIDALLLNHKFYFEIDYKNEFSLSEDCEVKIRKFEDGVFQKDVEYTINNTGNFQIR